jgi:sugar phosphate isomerase/epimerase
MPSRTTLAEYFQSLAELGISRTGVARPRMLEEGWEASLALLATANLHVGYMSYNRAFSLAEPETWAQATGELLAAIDAHESFGSRIYCLTGPGPAIGLTWEEATDAFLRAVRPAAAHARALGVSLMLEPTNSAFADLHCVHSLRETLEIVEAADMDICVEVDPSWMERALRNTILAAGPRIGLVQLSDRKLGSRCMDRAVPGDGIVPLEPIIDWILETGYSGPFDLELWGNTGREEAEGVMRGLDHLGKILERLGA